MITQAKQITMEECSEKIYDHVRGTVICADNGLVLEERLVDQGPYWRAYSPEEMERVQVGAAAYVQEDSVIETTFLMNKYDFNLPETAKVSIDKIRNYMKLKKLNDRVKADKDRTYYRLQKLIVNFSKKLNIPTHVVDDAKKILKNVIRDGVYRSNIPYESVAAACLVYAARKNKIYISIDTLEKIISSPNNYSTTRRFYRKLLEKYGMPSSNVEFIISSICSKLSLPQEIEETAKKIYRLSIETGASSGKSPSVVAAACVYIASKIHNMQLSAKNIAEAASITDTSVRVRSEDMLKRLKRSRANDKENGKIHAKLFKLP